MTAMSSIADVTIAEQATIPRFEDGFVNMRESLRQLAELVVNEIMSAEADQLCEATYNSGNGYRERSLVTCVGTLALRIPKLRTGSFFPDDVIERHQRVDARSWRLRARRARRAPARARRGGWRGPWA